MLLRVPPLGLNYQTSSHRGRCCLREVALEALRLSVTLVEQPLRLQSHDSTSACPPCSGCCPVGVQCLHGYQGLPVVWRSFIPFSALSLADEQDEETVATGGKVTTAIKVMTRGVFTSSHYCGILYWAPANIPLECKGKNLDL